eukprot:CAMPEP_0168221046 /NCGR_PEP_ID=MMETSP0140_2-20121125/9654_1 /TAXON_ID=44445 /ORGANISM="Pseudo-nitzschia australis, Strain 10249 10 AB" /LENGTH=81 /DNA_ID=CAMNT_0008150007 /DNA_START=609 /DNA_END=851 /DNA_ORIENTATION=-
MSIDKFKTIDSTNEDNCLVVDNIEPKPDTIFAKISQEMAKRNLALPRNTKLLVRGFVNDLMRFKSQVDRGKNVTASIQVIE